ncbi:glycoside hydrolase family 47 protein [Hypoxylon cercidicola]|nr:glycoside hydrolase family 47 protein [Hypoxylon cercidicola]
MFRLRRYRYYVFFAAIVVFLLYRATKNSEQWDSVSASIPYTKAPPKSAPERGFDTTNKQPSGKSGSRFPKEDDDLAQQLLEKPEKDSDKIKIPDLKPTTTEDGRDKFEIPTPMTTTDSTDKTKVLVYDQDAGAKTTTAALLDIPDKNVGQGAKGVGKGVHGAPGAHKTKTQTATTTIHWKKVPEHFPVPDDEVIPLPTGKPKPIPAVQFEFARESTEAKEKRFDRLAKVKAEMVRGWNGYMTYARGHDELKPVSKTFRDPFCGWAATLVDALDTLWIMGMKKEFEEALLEVEKIDFTTSEYRSEIPVFETTIRYLGGLVAAYDVSGGKAGGYDILLEKAVELAEILMGVFDTPNRMPVLYYNWKPAFASLPKRAQAGVSVAELGSLAMEFTRLAQITKEDRYYDAVARITDAFYEWQERGTTIPGIFPERVDATGCNRTAEAEIAAKKAQLELEQIELEKPDSKTGKGTKPPSIDEVDSQSNSAKDESHTLRRRSAAGTPNDDGTEKVKTIHNGEEVYTLSEETVPKKERDQDTSQAENQSNSLDSQKEKEKDKCVHQGLAPGSWSTSEQYSMGGSQDSTYEYFPKQWLLLGGLEPKYKTMHTKVAAAVKKWLLYRPMVPDDRDILFSAKINTQGNPEIDAATEWEVTHLTCFIGGMFGMGGKIFEVPEDVEIGKRLTDGCVWAYENTPSGIMPEGATVVPCAEVNNCHWNETLYWQWLDPLYESRNEQIAEFEKKQKERKAQKAQNAKMKGHKNLGMSSGETGSSEGRMDKSRAADFDEELGSSSQGVAASGLDTVGIQKRAPPTPIGPSTDSKSDSGRVSEKSTQANELEDEQDINTSSSAAVSSVTDDDQVPLSEADDDSDFPDPASPMSHKEYVENKILSENLPPGFVSADYHAYILRPEAIESVWYMYRITGDTTWQDKGWKMFSSIVSQTRTEAGNSAISNVLIPNPDKTDEMESFWLAETLKYFYLLYSDPDLISLDEWVLNTEAHPFKRPT